MSDNRFECGCERGGDCTKTTMCALQSALEDRDEEIERLQSVVDAAKDAWFKSGAFDNYECYFGATLGKCPQSNDCWECQLHQALTALEDSCEGLENDDAS